MELKWLCKHLKSQKLNCLSGFSLAVREQPTSFRVLTHNLLLVFNAIFLVQNLSSSTNQAEKWRLATIRVRNPIDEAVLAKVCSDKNNFWTQTSHQSTL